MLVLVIILQNEKEPRISWRPTLVPKVNAHIKRARATQVYLILSIAQQYQPGTWDTWSYNSQEEQAGASLVRESRQTTNHLGAVEVNRT